MNQTSSLLGILNVDTSYRKNPATERRTSRANDQEQWVFHERPDLRIISDELWAKVKQL